MPERKRYVVDIDVLEVKDIQVGKGTEYEIVATHDEKQQIEASFLKMKGDSIDSLKHILIPFNEKQVDKDRESYGNHLKAIFQTVRDLGTDKTKTEIDSLRVLE